jgi:hypothetical protein
VTTPFADLEIRLYRAEQDARDEVEMRYTDSKGTQLDFFLEVINTPTRKPIVVRVVNGYNSRKVSSKYATSGTKPRGQIPEALG